MSPQPKAKGKPGNSCPASSRFLYPRPPLEDFTKVDAIQKQSPPTSVGGPAAVYFGASPVASALDRFHTNMPSSSVWSKPDISTLQRIGHFYFALIRRFSNPRSSAFTGQPGPTSSSPLPSDHSHTR